MGWEVDTVGELRRILAPFADECRTNSIMVEYEKELHKDAKLIIKLITGNKPRP